MKNIYFLFVKLNTLKTQLLLLMSLLASITLYSQKATIIEKNNKTEYNYPIAVTPQNLHAALNQKKAAFVVRAFHNGFDTKDFEEKYGVRIIFANCVGTYFGNDALNNKTIAEFLTKKFGEDWKKEIPIMPLGL